MNNFEIFTPNGSSMVSVGFAETMAKAIDDAKAQQSLLAAFGSKGVATVQRIVDRVLVADGVTGVFDEFYKDMFVPRGYVHGDVN